jgi:hypothetical protein
VTIPRFEERLDTLIHNRGGRPILHGAIAAWIGCSIEQAATEIERAGLLESGRLRRLEADELRAHGWRRDVVAYWGA